MLDEDPAKPEAWSAESSALIYTTGPNNTTYLKHTEAKEKRKW